MKYEEGEIGTLEDANEAKTWEHDGSKYSQGFSSAPNLYKTSSLPVLFINKELKIIYANEAFEQMLSGFTELQGKYFFDLFGKAFKFDDAQHIKKNITQGNSTFSWKGSTALKARGNDSLQIMVYICPLGMDIKTSSDFLVMFDDFTGENRKLLKSVFLSLLEASKLKDNDKGKHTDRVNEYSKLLAGELRKIGGDEYSVIDSDFIEDIGFLAAMHDVGKAGTPDDILNKNSPLSDWEWTVMREHTKNGAYILSTYPNPMAKEIALFHHEKWDGTGYPFKLEGSMIPLAARIVTIADVYDALRMERVYKPSLSHEVSKLKIIEQSGKHFDPKLIEVFNAVSDIFKSIYAANQD